MKGKNTKTQASDRKTYVKPTVTKHTAASLVVGSGCSCGNYSSSSGSGGLVSCYYH